MTRKIKNLLITGTAVSCLATTVASAAEIPTNAAIMQAMDKVTGRVNKITVPVNSKIAFGDFSLVLRACKTRPAEETPENFAFVDVADKSFGTEEYNIFRGWLISSTPGINAIEHPIYDVWLLECVNAEVEGAKFLTPEELAARDNLPGKDVILGKAEPEIKIPEEEIQKPEEKVIHIKDFTQQDRDIEKDIKPAPAYISEQSAAYVSDIPEGEEPQNLLQFMQIQEETAKPADEAKSGKKATADTNAENEKSGKKATADTNAENEWDAEIDAELESLRQN